MAINDSESQYKVRRSDAVGILPKTTCGLWFRHQMTQNSRKMIRGPDKNIAIEVTELSSRVSSSGKIRSPMITGINKPTRNTGKVNLSLACW